jgi:hypothetical protein
MPKEIKRRSTLFTFLQFFLFLLITTISMSPGYLSIIVPTSQALPTLVYPNHPTYITIATTPTVRFQQGSQGSSTITNNGVTATITISTIPKNNGFESSGTRTASGGSGAVVQDSSTAQSGTYSGKTDSRSITGIPSLTQSSLNLPISSVSSEAGSFSFYIRNGGSATLGYNVGEIIFTSTG